MAINQDNGQNGNGGISHQNGMQGNGRMNGDSTWEVQGRMMGEGASWPSQQMARLGQTSRMSQGGDENGGSGDSSEQIRMMKQRKRAAHKAKSEMYQRKQNEAIDKLARLTRQNVTDEKESVKKALAYALKNGTPTEAAEAIMMVIDYCWGCCENEAEEAAKEAARSVEEEDMD